MRKIKYKASSDFGENREGDVVDAYVLLDGIDTNSALVYHPKTSKDTCASLEFCRENRDGYWTEARAGDCYMNVDSQKLLTELARNVAALKYRRQKQEV